MSSITHSITQFVGDHGVYAIFLLMLIDSIFPAGSELVMVYGGALAAGAFSSQHVLLFGERVHSHAGGYLTVALAGTIGYLVGSWLGWAIGRYGGRPLVERRGRWLHLGEDRLARAERWFERRGRWAVLVGRITPVVRSFVSIPAGVLRIPLGPYSILTLIGSAIWCFAIAGIGLALGTSYKSFHNAFDALSIAIVVLIVAAATYLWWRRRAGTATGPATR